MKMKIGLVGGLLAVATLVWLAAGCASSPGSRADEPKAWSGASASSAADARLAEQVSESRLSNDQKAEGDAVLGTLIWNELKINPPTFDDFTLDMVRTTLVGKWKGQLNFLGAQPFQLDIKSDGTWFFRNAKGNGSGEWIFRPRRIELWEPKLAELDFAVGSISNSWRLITLHTAGGSAALTRE
jgi:hypothetical protein